MALVLGRPELFCVTLVLSVGLKKSWLSGSASLPTQSFPTQPLLSLCSRVPAAQPCHPYCPEERGNCLGCSGFHSLAGSAGLDTVTCFTSRAEATQRWVGNELKV